jgi:hypothetical protein
MLLLSQVQGVPTALSELQQVPAQRRATNRKKMRRSRILLVSKTDNPG